MNEGLVSRALAPLEQAWRDDAFARVCSKCKAAPRERCRLGTPRKGRRQAPAYAPAGVFHKERYCLCGGHGAPQGVSPPTDGT